MHMRFPFTRFVVTNVFIFSLVILASCKKEKSIEAGNGMGSSGTSVFVLVPSGSDCSDAATTGNFEVGTAVGLTDLVIVTVNVTKTGTWNYNTGTLNGLSFSGSGTFTITGDQVIALQASGKPVAAGNTTFPLNIGSATCSFTINVSAPGSNPAPGDPYYKATINGVNYTESVTATNDYEAGSGLSGQDDVIIGAGINHMTSPIPAGFTQMGVDKGIMHGYTAANEAQFKAFFPVGNHPYTPPFVIGGANPFEKGDGVVVYWTDKQGKHWNSSHITQAQPVASSFKIISVEDGHDLSGTYYVKVKMQFNCILYKEGTNETATLTNGEMVAYFGKI